MNKKIIQFVLDVDYGPDKVIYDYLQTVKINRQKHIKNVLFEKITKYSK